MQLNPDGLTASHGVLVLGAQGECGLFPTSNPLFWIKTHSWICFSLLGIHAGALEAWPCRGQRCPAPLQFAPCCWALPSSCPFFSCKAEPALEGLERAWLCPSPQVWSEMFACRTWFEGLSSSREPFLSHLLGKDLFYIADST